MNDSERTNNSNTLTGPPKAPARSFNSRIETEINPDSISARELCEAAAGASIDKTQGNLRELQGDYLSEIYTLPVLYENEKYILERSGERVWINGEIGLLGRFCRYAADVHDDSGNCLACLNAGTTIVDNETAGKIWKFFIDNMRIHHNIVLDEIPRKESV